jgi:hypothetical protein
MQEARLPASEPRGQTYLDRTRCSGWWCRRSGSASAPAHLERRRVPASDRREAAGKGGPARRAAGRDVSGGRSAFEGGPGILLEEMRAGPVSATSSLRCLPARIPIRPSIAGSERCRRKDGPCRRPGGRAVGLGSPGVGMAEDFGSVLHVEADTSASRSWRVGRPGFLVNDDVGQRIGVRRAGAPHPCPAGVSRGEGPLMSRGWIPVEEAARSLGRAILQKPMTLRGSEG